LSALARDEVAAYVAHRLTIAGYSRAPLFAKGALKAIHIASRGVPRLINILAHKSLLLLFGDGGQRVEKRHVRGAVDDTPACASPRWWFSRTRESTAAD
jgi:MSHA biogenesis protein MshM